MAAAWIVLAPLTVLPLVWMMLRRTDTTPLRLGAALLPGLVGASVMAGAVFALRAWLAMGQWPVVASLLLQVTIGAAVYAGVLWGFFRERVMRYVRFVRELRKERDIVAGVRAGTAL